MQLVIVYYFGNDTDTVSLSDIQWLGSQGLA